LSGSFGTTVGALPNVDRKRFPWGSLRVPVYVIRVFQDVAGEDRDDVGIGPDGSCGD